MAAQMPPMAEVALIYAGFGAAPLALASVTSGVTLQAAECEQRAEPRAVAQLARRTHVAAEAMEARRQVQYGFRLA